MTQNDRKNRSFRLLQQIFRVQYERRGLEEAKASVSVHQVGLQGPSERTSHSTENPFLPFSFEVAHQYSAKSFQSRREELQSCADDW